MSCFSVASSSRDIYLIKVGYYHAVRGLHIEHARLERSTLRATLVQIARRANHDMIAAKRAARGES